MQPYPAVSCLPRHHPEFDALLTQAKRLPAIRAGALNSDWSQVEYLVAHAPVVDTSGSGSAAVSASGEKQKISISGLTSSRYAMPPCGSRVIKRHGRKLMIANCGKNFHSPFDTHVQARACSVCRGYGVLRCVNERI